MTCFLSVVAAARNDDYGGDFLSRLQVFVNLLAYQFTTFGIDGELLLVDWNPPKDKPLLKDALTWPRNLKARVFVVGNEIHDKFPNPRNVTMFQFIASNAAIRRSSGRYILATNADVIFNTELAEFLASQKLDSDCFYRADRYDVFDKIPFTSSPLEILSFCSTHFSKADLRGGSIDVPCQQSTKLGQLRWEIRRSAHEIQSRYRRVGFYREGVHLLRRLDDVLYGNASGCFTLMSRENWFYLKGSSEDPLIFLADSYLISAAFAMGLHQVQLPSSLRMYHLDHQRVWTQWPYAHRAYLEWLRDTRQMLSSKKPIIYNDDNWGLAGYKLDEYSFGAS